MIKNLLGLKIYAYVAVIATGIGFASGWYLEAMRFAEYRGAAEALAAAQEKIVQDVVKKHETLKRDSDNAWKNRTAGLSRNIATLRSQLRNARASIVPAAPTPSTGGGGESTDSGLICFAREKLRGGIDGALAAADARFAQSVERGARAIAGFEACSSWALEMHKILGQASMP